MKRKAVLIESSNVKNQTDLPGARVDVQNWKSFLTSDLGGAWTDAEIVSLNKPFSSELENHLKIDPDCYCFVAFSGHGCDGSIVLNDHLDSYPIASLKPKGIKGTLIIDACRGIDDARAYSAMVKEAFLREALNISIANEALQGRASVFASASAPPLLLNRAAVLNKFRTKWNNALNSCSGGVVQMLACAKGQAAGENPSAGGYYTSLLLHSAALWDQRTTSPAVHTTKEAHDYAASKLPRQQTPEYSPSWLAYPFAVRT